MNENIVMRTWFAKFRISAALDSGSPLSELLKRRLAGSEQVRRFERDVSDLERALKDSKPPSAAPPQLHSSIMGAIHATDRLTAGQSPTECGKSIPALWRAPWLAAPALAVVLIAGVCWICLRPSPAPGRLSTLAAASTAIDVSSQVAQAVPSAVMAPLSDEWERIESDCNGGVEAVLASLP
jgi:hypothetical protein